MRAEVAASIGAERHERTADRTAYRNGTRTRTWDTRVGTIELSIPKVTPGSSFPSLLQPRRRAEHALLAVVQEAYVHGVSTRKVDELMRALGLEGLSKSEVSPMCGELDPLIEAFRTRPLTGEHPSVWLDATDHKVRVDGRVVATLPSSFHAQPARDGAQGRARSDRRGRAHDLRATGPRQAMAQLRKIAVLEDAAEDVLAYRQFPVEHPRQIHSTNPLERLHKEIERRC